MKKILPLLLAAMLAVGCSSGTAVSEADADNPVAEKTRLVQDNPTQENATALLDLIFENTANGYDRQFSMNEVFNGTKVNFLGADDLVQMDSTTIADFTALFQYYMDQDTLYRTETLSDSSFEASITKDEEMKVLSARQSDGAYTVFSTNETKASSTLEQACYVLELPLTGLGMLADILYLDPVSNPDYFDWELASSDDGLQLTISIQNKKKFTSENKKQMAAAGYAVDYFDVFDIQEDTFTLDMSQDGVLTSVSQTFKARFVVDDIEKSEELTNTATIQKLDSFDTAKMNEMFEKDFETGAQINP